MSFEEDGIIKAFEESLIENCLDPTMDFLEDSIDVIFDDEVLKNIPIVKSIYAAGKTIVSIRDKYLCKRIIAFFKEFNQDRLSKEKLQAHIEKRKRLITGCLP